MSILQWEYQHNYCYLKSLVYPTQIQKFVFRETSKFPPSNLPLTFHKTVPIHYIVNRYPQQMVQMPFCELSHIFHKQITNVSQHLFVILLWGILPLICHNPGSSFYLLVGSNWEKCGKFGRNSRFFLADIDGLRKYCTDRYGWMGSIGLRPNPS